jgi:two-component system nitrate/nitrite sensor histidine kinase NarX
VDPAALSAQACIYTQASAGSVPKREKRMSANPPNTPQADILVVDDQPESLRLLTTILKERGYKVRAAADGCQALSAAQSEPPDLILLDVLMPGLSGYEVCEALKEDASTRFIPVIFSSSVDETVDKLRGFALGGVDFITKPLQAEEVLARVETHLSLRRLQKSLVEQNKRLEREVAIREQAQEALRASEQRYRAIFETSGTAMLIAEEDMTITLVNAAFERLSGYWNPELIGKFNWTEFAAQVDLERLKSYHWACRNHPDSAPRSCEFRFIDRRRNGTDLVATATLIPGTNQTVVSLLDISDRKRAEEELQRAYDELATILALSNGIASTLELEPLLELILDQLAHLVDYGSVAVLTLAGDFLACQAYRGAYPAADIFAHNVPLKQVTHIPLFHELIVAKQPFYIPNLDSEPGLVEAIEAVLGFPFLEPAIMGVPLSVEEQVIGMLLLMDREPGHFRPRELDLVQAFADRVASAIQNAQQYAAAQVVAADEGRHRLARELHDAVTQTLFSASLIAEALPAAWEQSPEKGLHGLEELRSMTRGALAEMRALLLELRPAGLTEKPLSELLRNLTEAVTSHTKVPVRLTSVIDGDPPNPPDLQIALYRITQEALNNVAKHAEASHVNVTYRCEPLRGELSIRDDGCGFDPLAIPPGGVGLGGMRERAEQVGATLCVESRPGEGTKVVVVWENGGG